MKVKSVEKNNTIRTNSQLKSVCGGSLTTDKPSPRNLPINNPKPRWPWS